MWGDDILNFIAALSIMIISVLLLIISTIITLLVGITLADHIGLTGIGWWAFIILFWIVVTSILNMKSR